MWSPARLLALVEPEGACEELALRPQSCYLKKHRSAKPVVALGAWPAVQEWKLRSLEPEEAVAPLLVLPKEDSAQD